MLLSEKEAFPELIIWVDFLLQKYKNVANTTDFVIPDIYNY